MLWLTRPFDFKDILRVRDPVSSVTGGDFDVQYSVAIWGADVEREIQYLCTLGKSLNSMDTQEVLL